MKKRWIALLLAAVLPIGVLAGCGSEDMPELSLDSITAPVAARNEMEVRTALGNYTGISEAAPDSADGEMATVQFAGDASATTALHDGYIYVLSNSELRILRAQTAQMPKEDNTHERVLQDFSDEELRALIRREKENG